MKPIIIFLVAANFFSYSIAQNKGSIVSFAGTDGKTYTGIITDISPGKYKVKYDGYDFEAWLTSNQFTLVNTNPLSPTQNQEAGKFKTGNRVEADKAGIDSWEKGTIMPHLKYDFKEGNTYRVRLDNQARGGMYLEGIVIPINRIRLINDAPYQQEKTIVAVGNVTVDADNTVSADRRILPCPAQQSQVAKSAKPNLELFKKIVRCNKGEKSAYKGYDGAVTVDITAMQVGSPRKWQYARDIGGRPGAIIYPVKTTYTVKTFYRTQTEVSDNWIRIINFFVNEFGEWTTGSEESIKAGDTKHIIRE